MHNKNEITLTYFAGQNRLLRKVGVLCIFKPECKQNNCLVLVYIVKAILFVDSERMN